MEKLLPLAKEYEFKTITRKQAVELFGSEGTKRHIAKHGKFKNKKYYNVLLKNLNQLFESVDDNSVKIGRAKAIVLGKARNKVAEREDNRTHNGKQTLEKIKKNKTKFLKNIDSYRKYDDELWLLIESEDIEKTYYVSNYGRIFSTRLMRVLKPYKNPDGYLVTRLKNIEGVSTTKLVHRVVAETFLTNPSPEKMIWVNHKDGDKGNAHVDNLEWCSPQENSHHAIRTGLRGFGKKRLLTSKPKPLTVEVVNLREIKKKIKPFKGTPFALFLLQNTKSKKINTNHFR